MGDILFTLFLVLFITFLSFKYTNLINISFSNTIHTFTYILVPSLFMMLIISKLLKYNPFINKLINYISPIFTKIFGFENKSEVYILVFSFLSGNPASHILINDLYKNGSITKNEANRLSKELCFCSFLYLYNTSIVSFKDDLLIILFLNYIIPIIRLINPKKTDGYNSYVSYEEENLSDIINNSFNTLIKIFSYVLFFDIVTSCLVSFFRINDSIAYILSSFLDTTVCSRFFCSFNPYLDLFIFCFFNSFLGISIHLQIINATNYLDYKKFLLYRIILGIISGILAIILKYNIIIGLIALAIIGTLIIVKKRTANAILNF